MLGPGFPLLFNTEFFMQKFYGFKHILHEKMFCFITYIDGNMNNALREKFYFLDTINGLYNAGHISRQIIFTLSTESYFINLGIIYISRFQKKHFKK